MSETLTFELSTTIMPALGPHRSAGWRTECVSDLSTAEQLLDWLEAEGVDERKLVIEESAFVVRWR